MLTRQEHILNLNNISADSKAASAGAGTTTSSNTPLLWRTPTTSAVNESVRSRPPLYHQLPIHKQLAVNNGVAEIQAGVNLQFAPSQIVAGKCVGSSDRATSSSSVTAHSVAGRRQLRSWADLAPSGVSVSTTRNAYHQQQQHFGSRTFSPPPVENGFSAAGQRRTPIGAAARSATTSAAVNSSTDSISGVSGGGGCGGGGMYRSPYLEMYLPDQRCVAASLQEHGDQRQQHQNKSQQHAVVSQLHRLSDSAVHIDDSSLDSNRSLPEPGKSLSENDSVLVSRKRVGLKQKSRRRNILSLPTVIGSDESKNQDVYGGSVGGVGGGGSSSSDENRSSGHASMSDGHASSSPPADTLPRHDHFHSQLRPVPEDVGGCGGFAVGSASVATCSTSGEERQQVHAVGVTHDRSRDRHDPRSRGKDDMQLPASAGLEDIKQAIAQLTLRSQSSRASYSTTSTSYSSHSGSESDQPTNAASNSTAAAAASSVPTAATAAGQRLVRQSSLETVNTNVTSADEFVWLDSHNRLVELQRPPWSSSDMMRLVNGGRLRAHSSCVAMETLPRLSYLLQRALVRVARETQRLAAHTHQLCTKHQVVSAFRVVLTPALADSCAKACMRAAAMYSVSSQDHVRQCKSDRAGLHLSVGKFQRWMYDVRLGSFVQEYSAVYLTAGIENILEELVLACVAEQNGTVLTTASVEQFVASSGDFWGLFQPHAHLNSARTAAGALVLPRFASSSISGDPADVSSHGSSSLSNDLNSDHTAEQALLTTCVGSIEHLDELVATSSGVLHRMTDSSCRSKQPVLWSPAALHTLFYFMRCSQLEHAQCTSHARRRPVQELVFERPYIVLPPIIEWVRTASAHASHRRASLVDSDDVMQAARLLLPGADCAPRSLWCEDSDIFHKNRTEDSESIGRLKVDLAFRMVRFNRPELVSNILQLLTSSKSECSVNCRNSSGMTPLMMACVFGHVQMAAALIEAGAEIDAETPSISTNTPATHSAAGTSTASAETQHWTALNFATIGGHTDVMRLLLERGACVEGAARVSEDKNTETPLQLAAGSGNMEQVKLLLTYCARPFLSTHVTDSLCYSAAAQKGCYSAIAVAAVHGHRDILHRLLTQPLDGAGKGSGSLGPPEELSLEEMLAETSGQNVGAAGQSAAARRINRLKVQPVCVDDPRTTSMGNRSQETSQMIKLNKSQVKCLQEAMCHSAESRHIEITLDLRQLGVPWTLHCWMTTLATAQESRLDNIIDQLLQDFLQVWPEDYSSQFVDDCLPLLFNIFRHSKNEGTSLLLADIFSCCYGRAAIPAIRMSPAGGSGPRIDPRFVNNAELSDAQFRVEGRVFHAHKIILVNASHRFRQMLSARLPDGNAPIVQINDIRYDIFQMVMEFLYKGGCDQLTVSHSDVLELMAAANFFELDALLRHCEVRCSQLVNMDTVVSMYIHAKVYSAVELLQFCQGYLLQNMVALLTYDDSARRLMLGRRLHNHDVLSALQCTLQSRCRQKATSSAPTITSPTTNSATR